MPSGLSFPQWLKGSSIFGELRTWICSPLPRTTNYPYSAARTRTLGRGEWTHSSALGQHGALRPFSVLPDSQDNQQLSRQQKRKDGPRGASVASERVVSGPVGIAGRSASGTPYLESSSQADARGDLPWKRGDVEASRVASIERLYRERGFSSVAARAMSTSVRKSSQKNYQNKWGCFVRWCRRQAIGPLQASILQVVEFFLYLRDSRKLSLSAVKGYRSALAQSFRLRGLDISLSPEVCELFKHFRVNCPPTPLRSPRWDLTLVLESLRKAPYEPLSTASDKDLTLKTVFLLALASSKRVSELHGLSKVVSHTREWSSVSLSLAPDFVAKNQIPDDPSSYVGTFSIPALTNLEKCSDKDLLLCPVRAMRKYLSRMSRSRPPSSSRLFLSCGPNKKEITRTCISVWLRQVIQRAHQGRERERNASGLIVREIRALSTALLFKKNYSVSQIMRAGQWRGKSTFTKFYLRDTAHRYLETYSLGPIVAGQSIIEGDH